MSKVAIEIHEKTTLEKGMRVKYLQKIAEQNTEDLYLLYRLANLSQLQKMALKSHPMVKKYIENE